MRRNGAKEEADALALAHDCFPRSGELLMLRVADVERASDDDVIIRLGVRERKEKTKTGSHQGVRVDWSGTAKMLARQLAARKPLE